MTVDPKVCAVEGCGGVRYADADECLAHLRPSELEAVLERVGQDAVVEAPGTEIDEALLERILDALPRGSDGRQRLARADFSGARFTGHTVFAPVVFEGDAVFSGAWFEHAQFDGTSFEGVARFEDVVFHGFAAFTNAAFRDRARFSRSRFRDDAMVNRATFDGAADFGKARFDGGAWFMSARFASTADFGGAVFEGSGDFEDVAFAERAFFNSADFQSGVAFKEARFASGCSFNGATLARSGDFAGATFGGDATFAETTFGDDADFRGAIFRDDVLFEARFEFGADFADARFEAEAAFDGCVFEGEAHFPGVTFDGETGFRGVKFEQEAFFSAACFGADVWFPAATFSGDAEFTGAAFHGAATFNGTFDGEVNFSGATFDGDAAFEATFERGADFARAVFNADASFRGAIFGEDALFREVTFVRARWLGPMLVLETLDMEDVTLLEPADIDVSVTRVVLSRARFPRGVDVWVRRGDILLDKAGFGASSMLGSVVEFEGLDGVTAGRWRCREGVPDRSWRPRLLSIRWANVENLTVSGVDLAALRFFGAHHLDGLRIEGGSSFALTPSDPRVTRRQAIAEEHEWRRANRTPLRAGGWYPSRCEAPEGLEPERVKAEDIAAIYRDLRKGREDNKDEPGAADFYYGEMEMRRLATSRAEVAERTTEDGEAAGRPPGRLTRDRGEHLILTLYWLVSGYGLRASRALASLFLTVLVFAALLYAWGFDSPQSFVESLTFSFESTTSLFRAPERDLTLAGEWMQMGLRLLGPLFFGLALLSLRGRIKR